jgi:hypothetical protein
MVSLAKKHNTQFQLTLGDNFYFDGVKSLKDKRFYVKSISFFIFNLLNLIAFILEHI